MVMQHLETALTKAEVDRRKDLLLQLKDALAARQVAATLAGRRTIVLRSAEDGEIRTVPRGPAPGSRASRNARRSTAAGSFPAAPRRPG